MFSIDEKGVLYLTKIRFAKTPLQFSDNDIQHLRALTALAELAGSQTLRACVPPHIANLDS